MKKDKFDMSNLGLPTKPQMVKPATDTQTILAKAVESIHKVEAIIEEPAPQPPVVEVKKVSMDLPVDLYKAVKYYSVEAGISMKDYIASLIRQDMATRKG